MSVTHEPLATSAAQPPEGVMGRYHQLLRHRLLMMAILLLAIVASLVLDFTLGPSGLSLFTLWQTLLSPDTVEAWRGCCCVIH